MSHPSVGLGGEHVRHSEACILLTVQVIHSSHRLALLTPVSTVFLQTVVLSQWVSVLGQVGVFQFEKHWSG